MVLTQPVDSAARALFSDTYWIMTLIGGLIGLYVSRKWGGLKSALGKSLSFFSFGLLAQTFGQVVYTYYARRLHVEVPYPSVGDVGFFGSIPLYALGVFYLGKVAGVRVSLRSFRGKILAVVLPLVLLAISYYVFFTGAAAGHTHLFGLQPYAYDPKQSLIQTLLDFGYPLGQAFYVSIALLTYFLSRKVLGGIMKNKILFILVALAVQYAADFVFLFQNNRQTWYAGGINDFMYLVAYLLMTLALLGIGAAYAKLSSEPQTSAPEDK